MRVSLTLIIVSIVGVSLGGCKQKEFDGPIVKSFTGRSHEGNPVSFPADEKVRLELFHESAQSFIIPIQEDGSFTIGWMPIGKYSATLTRDKSGAKASRSRYSVPDGLRIEDGKTEYTIELGKDWKPK
jgi:hypothetical protein